MKWKLLRWLLVLVSVGVTVYITLITLDTRDEARKHKIENLDFQNPVKAAIDNKLSTSRTFLQTALIIAGALWGLLIGKGEGVRIVLGDWPEKLMFVLANSLIFASLWNGYQYTEEITLACVSAIEKPPDQFGAPPEKDKFQIADVFGPRFNYRYVLQSGYLVIGAFVSGLTLLSVHRLKER